MMEQLTIWQLVQVPRSTDWEAITIGTIIAIKEKRIHILTILWTEVSMDLETAQLMKLDLMSNALKLALASFSHMPNWSSVQLKIKDSNWKIVFDKTLVKWWKDRISDS